MKLRYVNKSIFFLQRLTTKNKIAKDKGLMKIGALVRGAVRRTLRISSGPSLPGRPPHAHTQGGLRIVEFVAGQKDVIIGPVKFSNSNFFDKPITYIHEFGGIFYSKKGFFQYPERSYMGHTLKQLHAKGLIPKTYATEIRKVF